MAEQEIFKLDKKINFDGALYEIEATQADDYNPEFGTIKEALHFTESNPVLNACGGIGIGATFDNVPIKNLVHQMLYPESLPTVSIKVITNPDETISQIYTEKRVTQIDLTVTKNINGDNISAVEIYKAALKEGNNEPIISEPLVTFEGTELNTINNSGTGTLSYIPESDKYESINIPNVVLDESDAPIYTYFIAKVIDDSGRVVTASSDIFKFVLPYFSGYITSADAESSFTGDLSAFCLNECLYCITDLKTILCKKAVSSYAVVYNTNTDTTKNSKIVFISPYKISSIKDFNNLDLSANFDEYETEIEYVIDADNDDYRYYPYYVYIIKNATSAANFKLKFTHEIEEVV